MKAIRPLLFVLIAFFCTNVFAEPPTSKQIAEALWKAVSAILKTQVKEEEFFKVSSIENKFIEAEAFKNNMKEEMEEMDIDKFLHEKRELHESLVYVMTDKALQERYNQHAVFRGRVREVQFFTFNIGFTRTDQFIQENRRVFLFRLDNNNWVQINRNGINTATIFIAMAGQSARTSEGTFTAPVPVGMRLNGDDDFRRPALLPQELLLNNAIGFIGYPSMNFDAQGSEKEKRKKEDGVGFGLGLFPSQPSSNPEFGEPLFTIGIPTHDEISKENFNKKNKLDDLVNLGEVILDREEMMIMLAMQANEVSVVRFTTLGDGRQYVVLLLDVEEIPYDRTVMSMSMSNRQLGPHVQLLEVLPGGGVRMMPEITNGNESRIRVSFSRQNTAEQVFDDLMSLRSATVSNNLFTSYRIRLHDFTKDVKLEPNKFKEKKNGTNGEDKDGKGGGSSGGTLNIFKSFFTW